MSENVNRLADLDLQSEEAATERLLDQLAKAHGAEAHAAEVIAAECLLDHFRYAPALGWLEWDGVRWDDDPEVSEKVIETVRQFNMAKEAHYRARQGEHQAEGDAVLADIIAAMSPEQRQEAARMKPGEVASFGNAEQQAAYDEAEKLRLDAKRQADIWGNLLSLAKISSLSKLCRAMDGIRTRTTAFDADPHLLNCRNCVVDLRTGDTLDHHPDLLMTKVAGGEYRPGYQHPLWDKALEAVHPDVLEWFQERAGQSFSGFRPADDSLVVSAGGGENGKSAVMESLLRAAGSYGDIISHRILLASAGQHPTEMMDLRGLRLAYMDETEEEGRLDTHRLKTTIGTGQIKARHMRKDSVTFKATHTMWINTNHKPQVDATDHGTWRRLFAMPWPFRFRKPWEELEGPNDRTGDLSLRPSLESDPDVVHAVIAWTVKGAVAHFSRTEPMRPPAPVTEATTEWRRESDVGLQYATEYLTAAPGHFITAEEMFTEFNRFLDRENKREWSKQLMNTRFPESLAAAGITVQKTPVDKPKIGQKMTQSHGPSYGKIASDPFGREDVPVDIPAGKTARIWLGVRFRTAAEQGQPLAEAV